MRVYTYVCACLKFSAVSEEWAQWIRRNDTSIVFDNGKATQVGYKENMFAFLLKFSSRNANIP